MTRTADDSWDLASSVGATATAVAATRATASQGPNALLDDPWAEPLVRAVGMEMFVKVVDGESLADDDDPLLNRRAMNEQMAVRTRFFDDFFMDSVSPVASLLPSGAAAGAGVRQAVILASGLDTRAYRLAWPAGTVVYEIDQPEVVEFKTRTLAGLGAEPTAQRRTVAIDLRNDWAKALKEKGFDPAAPTAWSAEGLLVYLPPEAQDRLFDDITALSAPGSRIATEHMDLSSIPADWAEKLTERTKRLGSEIDLAELFYTGERNSAADYLAKHGWHNTILPTAQAYAANGFQLPDDELATFGGNSGYLTSALA